MKKEIAVDRLIENADKCVNMLDLCHRIGITNVGGEDYKEVRELAKELGVELVFSYKRKNKTIFTKKTLDEILVENSDYGNLKALKKRLFSAGIKKEKCECCGIEKWNGKPISFQLHHINGVHNDNRIENLQILCPNCHSQTDTYAGKNANRESSTTLVNKTKYRSMKKDEWDDMREKIWKKTHPSKETLLDIFAECGSFSKMGKLYDVSDNAVRKWFKKYGLPYKKKELKDYIRRCSQEVDGISLQN